MQSEIDDNYKKANAYHHVSLVTGGIAATIYISDIIWAISKGSKNAKSSKALKKRLQNTPIEIQRQSISLQ